MTLRLETRKTAIAVLACLAGIFNIAFAEGPAASSAAPAGFSTPATAAASATRSAPLLSGTPSMNIPSGGNARIVLKGQSAAAMQTGSPAAATADVTLQQPADGKGTTKSESPKIEKAVEKGTTQPSDGKAQQTEASPIEKAMSDGASQAQNAEPQPSSVGQIAQFGYSFFRPDAAGFAPLTDIPVGPDYVIGVGDRIVLTLWGSIDGSHELEVNRNGEITLPKVGTVPIAGNNFGQLQQVIQTHLAKVFKDFQLNVTIGKLRLIKVYLVGEVWSPGDYNVSSLSTLINALSAAGGPTKNGSLRNIQIKRNGTKVETVDLYDFFLKGDKSRDIRLQSGDTIFVPAIGPVAGIAGNVRKPAIYELKDEKSLKELLALAGGINPTGYLQRIQVSRVEAHDKRLVDDFSLDPKSGGKTIDELTGSITIQDLDLVKIFPIDSTLRGYVRLDGYVLRPGDYALKPGMRLCDLIGKDNLLPEHYAEAVMVTRLFPPDFHTEKIFCNLKRAMAGDSLHDLALQEFDSVWIFSRREMEEAPTVSIIGEVQRPGPYRLTEKETVSDLVKEAGNLKRLAFTKKAEIRRIRVEGDQLKPYSVYINLEEAMKGNPEHNLMLAPFDEVVVKKYDFDETKIVRISGEIQRPGEYRLVEKMTIADLVLEAGNLKKTAFTKNAEITRLKISGESVTSFPITVDLEEALKGNPKENIMLEPQDTVTIRRIPNWTEETERYVTLRGEFRFPGVYPIYKGEKLSTIIERAGGFTDKAYFRGAKFTRVSIRELQQKRMDEIIVKTEQELLKKQAEVSAVALSKEEMEGTRAALESLQRSLDLLKTAKTEGRLVIRIDRLENFRGSPYDVELMGGDELAVPQMPNVVNVLGQVYNPTSIIPIDEEDVAFYLGKAGGPTRDAEESDIYVVRVDGTVMSRHQVSMLRSLFFSGFMSARLEPGDTVVVPQKFERIAWIREIRDIATTIGQLALTAGIIVAAGL